MPNDRRRIEWKHPLVIAGITYVIAALIQWGSIQARLAGVETAVRELRSELDQISVAIVVRQR